MLTLRMFIMLILLYNGCLSANMYKIIDLKASDELFATTNYATNINNFGQVTGRCIFGKNYIYIWDETHGFTFINSGGFSIGPGNYNPYINNKGAVSEYPITDSGHTYYIDDSQKLCKSSIGVIENTLKWDKYSHLHVNNSGQILGNILDNSGKANLIIYNEITKSINYIKYLKYDIKGCDINELGWAIGYYSDGVDIHGILWTPEFGIQKLHLFRPSSINNLGIIVGSYRVEQGIFRAALWKQGEIIDISHALNIDSDTSTELLYITEISDINDAGQMTGWGPVAGKMYTQQAIMITPLD